MTRLAIATIATRVPMGAQVYEEEVASRSEEALAKAGQTWTVERVVARSLRSDLNGTLRIPLGLLERGGATTRKAIGRLVYPRNSIVHRMGLTLPPSPGEVVTLHDIVAWRFSDEGTPIATAAEELREAAFVICVSENTAADAAELFGLDNTRVVHPGVDNRFREPALLTAETQAALGLSGRYVLHAGGASERKNLGALASAWSRIHSSFPDVSLALSGPPHPRRTELFHSLPRVVFLGRIADDLVPGVLAGAEAVVVPSLYEGFGLPVLESMAAGTPVVVASTSSLVEVAGNAGVLVDPTSDGVAEGLSSVLRGAVDIDALVREGHERARGFTWERCAAEHAAVWTEAALART